MGMVQHERTRIREAESSDVLLQKLDSRYATIVFRYEAVQKENQDLMRENAILKAEIEMLRRREQVQATISSSRI